MPQMRGAKDDAVFIYRESFATKQMRHTGLTRWALFSSIKRVVLLVTI